LSKTSAPTFSVLVASAATDRAAIGASWSPKWSGIVSVLKPLASARFARSTHSVREEAFEAWMPNRKGRCAVMGAW